ncbi:hypothetical protein N7456_009156 [Penicillium angulare]|uniref:alpha-glucosidase n=1 Tax=Penicillium angulare TaxID=116970 RepID=A0A9W9F4F2_9EURO|nr:hypothetical protein N7456_009156 [Penicillium angulare]
MFSVSADEGATLIANIDDPEAVDAQSTCPGYKASNTKNTDTTFQATLTLAGSPCNVYGTDVDSLDFLLEYLQEDVVKVSITPTYLDSSNESWFILPDYLVPPTKVNNLNFKSPYVTRDENEIAFGDAFSIEWSNEPSFQFRLKRASNQDVIFDTFNSVLVFEDQFIEFVTALPSDYNIYGLGEHNLQSRLLENLTLTLYATDIPVPINSNLYGSHPFYLDTRYFELDNDGNHTPVAKDQADQSKNYVSYSHGVFFRNTHGQEILTHPQKLTWRSLGGSVDLTFYLGPSQEEVTKSYQVNTVGLPAMQQYFTFGYHQCRFGYRDWSAMDDLVSNFEKSGIPLENVWNDIDYMKNFRDFTNDPVRFGYREGKDFLSKLHDGGRHYIPIVDAAIYSPNPHNEDDKYDTYTRGAEDDVFLKNPDGSLYVGTVWPGNTVFTDWHHPKAGAFWANELVTWHEDIAFDGIWIDMNEPASFCVGSCGSRNLSMDHLQSPSALLGEQRDGLQNFLGGSNPTNTIDSASEKSAIGPSLSPADFHRSTPTPGVRNINYPPYVINNVQGGHDLAAHTVSPNATHFDGIEEYDVHNIYGYQVLNATYHGLLEVNSAKRPFIIGRGTFAGSGKWAGHWGGDNWSTWAYMFFSIPHALSFSLFGIPMFGVDTCGFNGNTNEELCSRWMQLSAFFPFYRNHNNINAVSQEPYRWASVADASKTAMKIRYAILPYFYTLFHLAHTTGSTVMRALAWEFPNDPSLAGIDTQFLLGPSIMVIPVLAPQVDYVRGVFPGIKQGEIWYDWYNQTAVSAQPGVNTTISAPLGHIPIYLRGGSIIPTQKSALTVRDSRNSEWSLIAALSSNGTASGQVYLDDGESVTPESTLDVIFKATQYNFTILPQGDWKEFNKLANITILGVTPPPASTMNSHSVAVKADGRDLPPVSAIYDPNLHIFYITNLQSLTQDGAFSRGIVLEW